MKRVDYLKQAETTSDLQTSPDFAKMDVRITESDPNTGGIQTGFQGVRSPQKLLSDRKLISGMQQNRT